MSNDTCRPFLLMIGWLYSTEPFALALLSVNCRYSLPSYPWIAVLSFVLVQPLVFAVKHAPSFVDQLSGSAKLLFLKVSSKSWEPVSLSAAGCI